MVTNKSREQVGSPEPQLESKSGEGLRNTLCIYVGVGAGLRVKGVVLRLLALEWFCCSLSDVSAIDMDVGHVKK